MSGLRAFTMPKWGIEMTEGIVTEWHVGEGDAIAKGQLVVSVETDKIVNDIEADFDTVCLRRLAAEGETLDVGELLAVFGAAGTDAGEVDAFVSGFSPAQSEPADDTTDASAGNAPDSKQPAVPAPALPAGVRASPAAVAAAGRAGVDLAQVSGSGRDGRIQHQDVVRATMPPYEPKDSAVDITPRLADDSVPATDIARRIARERGTDLKAAAPSGRYGRVRAADLTAGDAGSGSTVAFSNMRAQIAKRLTASYRDIPHYYLQTRVRLDALLERRAAFNAGRERNASITDMLVHAVARTLIDHPAINAHVGDGESTRFAVANVALAVALEDGLITPVVHAAEGLDLQALATVSRDLVKRAREGALRREDLEGGTFTVSNLGMFGITEFTALINPPQAAILAVGAARRVAFELGDGIKFGSEMTLTLGCDHRVIDGATGGRFLADLKARLESKGDGEQD